MTTVPQPGSRRRNDLPVAELPEDPFPVQAALRYAGVGWKVLWLVVDSSEGKIPPRNCPRCDFGGGAQRHDMASCPCLTCHSFHAATCEPGHIRAAYRHLKSIGREPHLAVATGKVSGLLVVDAEQGAGVESLDRIQEATGGLVDVLPPTLTARSVSGGLHLFFRLAPGSGYVTSGRVLPDVDVKVDGGYVGVVDGQSARSWVNVSVGLADAPRDLLAWLGRSKRLVQGGVGRAANGGSGGQGTGAGVDYNFAEFCRQGCPDGYRDYFFNDLLFRSRKSGRELAELVDVAWTHWRRVAQPPHARWEMPWEHVEGKIRRIMGEVVPDRYQLDEGRHRWVQGLGGLGGLGGLAPPVGVTRRIGNVTVVGVVGVGTDNDVRQGDVK